MVTIQFQLRSHKLSDMTAEERIAFLDTIKSNCEAAARRGEVYMPEGPANPFPEWLRKEIERTQGWVWLRRIWHWVSRVLKVPHALTRELKWDQENQVYKLVHVPDEEADAIREEFYRRCIAAMKRDPARADELCRQKLEIRVAILQDSIVAVAADEDLWPDGEPPADREDILANVMSPQGGKKDGTQ